MKKYTKEDKNRWLYTYEKCGLNKIQACIETEINIQIIDKWCKLKEKDKYLNGSDPCTFKEAMDTVVKMCKYRIRQGLYEKAINDKDTGALIFLYKEFFIDNKKSNK